MSQASPSRPTRRAAQQKRIVDSSDEENATSGQTNAQFSDVDDDFSLPSSPTKSGRRPARRTIQASAATPQTASRPSRRKTTKPADDTQEQLDTTGITPVDSVPPIAELPRPKRRNVRAGRRSMISIAQDEPSALPTPEPSQTPEPPQPLASPETSEPADATTEIATAEPEHPQTQEPTESLTNDLDNGVITDITIPAVDEQPLPAMTELSEALPTVKEEAQEKPAPPSFEKPMDIVIRTRAKPAANLHDSSEPKPRLVITYLVLNNFKSYAGRQEVGPFHASFSSVVGPNGSGKSNVIDSLLFVFGFRASKMRQGKISALIHNSAAFPDLPYCEVEVHFQEVIDRPGGQPEVIADTGLIISRKAFRNNSSKYYLNGSESNFTAVTTLLKDRGTNQSSSSDLKTPSTKSFAV